MTFCELLIVDVGAVELELGLEAGSVGELVGLEAGSVGELGTLVLESESWETDEAVQLSRSVCGLSAFGGKLAAG